MDKDTKGVDEILELPKNIQQRLIAISDAASAQSERVVSLFKAAKSRKEETEKRDAEIKEKVKTELTEAAKAKRERKRLIRLGMPLPKKKKEVITEPITDEKGKPIIGKNERKAAMLAYDKEKHEERKQRITQRKKDRAEKKLAIKVKSFEKLQAEVLRFKNSEIRRKTKKAENYIVRHPRVEAKIRTLQDEPITTEFLNELQSNTTDIPYAA